jgi:hypothetical protein
MRIQGMRCLFFVALLAMLPASSARAQWYYPGGYGGYGWGGWGAGHTVAGDYARGFGNFAMGQGIYNQKTAVANAINVNTAMNLNEYLYESQQVQNRKYWARKAEETRENNAALAAIHDRLRNNPSSLDIDKGDALNVVLDELSDPRLSYQVSRFADAKLDGRVLRSIPFRNAVEAVTFSIDELGKREPAEVFRGPAFADDLKAYREIAAELNKQAEETGKIKSESVAKMRSILKKAYDKLKGMQGLDAQKKFDGERHLRATLGLTYMLEGPSLDIFLEGVENRNDITLAKVLAFMQSFNLRFGVVENPNQRQAYRTLYPLLVSVRKEVFGETPASVPQSDTKLAERPKRPKEFFAGLSPEDVDAATQKKSAPAPTPPPPGR